jgi:hypothetical protein
MNEETIKQFTEIDWTAKLKKAIKERQDEINIIYVATHKYEHFYAAFTVLEDMPLQDLVLLFGDPAIDALVDLLIDGAQVAFKGDDPYIDVKQVPSDEGTAFVFEFEVYFPIIDCLEKILAGQET